MNNIKSLTRSLKNKWLRLIFVSLILSLSQCSGYKKEKDSTTSDKQAIVPEDSFRVNTVYSSLLSRQGQQAYALYLPSRWTKSIHLPVFIFFDPHGDGSFAISKYLNLAEKFGVILIGSNGSKNGLNFDHTNAIANELITEAILRFQSDQQNISLAGFSGGAKAALAAASVHPEISSVIYCGAAFPPGSFQSLPPALGFAGVKDMNYTEVLSFDESLNSLSGRHAVQEWNGKHEWPDSTAFELSFLWSQLIANKDSSQRRNLLQQYLLIKAKDLKSPDILVREKTLKQIINFYKNDVLQQHYEKQLNTLQQKPELKEREKKEKLIFTEENKYKQMYIDAFASAPITWWENEVKRLSSSTENASQQRLLAYISLAAYSFSNNGLKQGDLIAAEKALEIYRIADPKNSEQPFLQACLFAKRNEPEKAINALNKAISLGLNNRSKIETESAFASLQSRSDFQELLNLLK